MMRRFSIAAVVLALCVGSAQAAAAQVAGHVCLTAGELKDDFIFGTQVLNNSLTRKARTIGPIHFPADTLENPGIFGRTIVEFAGPTILLDAFANRNIGVPFDRQVEAFARGKLFVDFAVDCGSAESASVVVAVSFRVRRVGRISTFWPGSTSSFGVSARIRDLAENRDIDFRVIEDTTVGNLLGNVKTIAKVPVPVPEIEALSLADVETFVISVRKGRVYRFELFAAAKSTTGLSTAPVVFAFANLYDPVPVDLVGNFRTAGIELAEFKMDVAVNSTDADVQQELSDLRRMVESLREAVASVSAQLEAVGPSMDALVSDLHEKLAEQDERHGQAVQALGNEFEHHTHDYLTGIGEGHNTTAVVTSKPKKIP
jgi:hypothetical protein